MGNLIILHEFRKNPHIAGNAHCIACLHKWVAVAPEGEVWLECPKCHCNKGLFKFPVSLEKPHWHCACGNNLFHLDQDSFYCPNCGLTQSF